MNLADLASIGNFVSGVAVVFSLIYLGLQVRHAQRAQRALMHQARVDRVTNASLAFAQGDVADVLAKAAAHPVELSSGEVMRLFYFVRIQVLAVDDALWQFDAGFLDAPSLETTLLTMRRLMANPALRAVWHLVRPQITPSVRARIDRIAEESTLVAPTDWAIAWRDDYAKLLVAMDAKTPVTE